MKTTEQTLLILDNDPEFKASFDAFKDVVLSSAAGGFSYKGKELKIVAVNKQNGTPARLEVKLDNGHAMGFSNDLPMSLYNAGYRINQFGMLFVADSPLSFSRGSVVFAAFRSKISRSLRKEVGYNESVTHDELVAAIALLKRIFLPDVQPTSA